MLATVRANSICLIGLKSIATSAAQFLEGKVDKSVEVDVPPKNDFQLITTIVQDIFYIKIVKLTTIVKEISIIR